MHIIIAMLYKTRGFAYFVHTYIKHVKHTYAA